MGDDGDSFDFHRPNSHDDRGRAAHHMIGRPATWLEDLVSPASRRTRQAAPGLRAGPNCTTALGWVEPVHLPPEIDQIELPGLVLSER